MPLSFALRAFFFLKKFIELLYLFLYDKNMKAIITVVGSDQVGIIARVSAYLAQHKINIADITQTILSGNFVMMMMADLTGSNETIESLRNDMAKLGEEMQVEINIMHEKVFASMHRI